VLTVPYFTDERTTTEPYPSLHDFESLEQVGSYVVVNEPATGAREESATPASTTVRPNAQNADLLASRRPGPAASRRLSEVISDWRERASEFDPCWIEPHSYPFVARSSGGRTVR
jgi:hypothetical protein